MKKSILLVVVLLIILSFSVNAGILEKLTGRQIDEKPEKPGCMELKDFRPFDSKAVVSIDGLVGKYLVYFYRDGDGDNYVIYDLEESKIVDSIPRDKYFMIRVDDNGILLVGDTGNFYYYDFINKKINLLTNLDELNIQEESSTDFGGIEFEEIYLLPDHSVLYALQKYSRHLDLEKDELKIEGLGTELLWYNPSTGSREKVYEFDPSEVERCRAAIPKGSDEIKEGMKVTESICFKEVVSPSITFISTSDNKVYFSLNRGGSGEIQVGSSEFYVYDINEKLVANLKLPKELGQLYTIDANYAIFLKPKEGEVGIVDDEAGNIRTERGKAFLLNVFNLNTRALIYTTFVLDVRYLGNNRLVYSSIGVINTIFGRVLPLQLFLKVMTPDFILRDLYTKKEIPVDKDYRKHGLPSMVAYKNRLLFTEQTGEKFSIKGFEKDATDIQVRGRGFSFSAQTLYSCKL